MQGQSRRHGPAAALGEFSSARLLREFDWGMFNCCTLVGEWIAEAERRGNPLADLPTTPTERAALRLLDELSGGGGLAALWTQLLGRAPLPSPRFACVGDPVVVSVDGRETSGICSGTRAVCVAVGRGMADVPMTTAVAAWRLEFCQ